MTAVSGAATASYGYKGDGRRVLATNNVSTIVYIGNSYEYKVSEASAKSYYWCGWQCRMGMATYTG